MELRHLLYFIAVADEGSFSGAAVRLRVSQPSLSRQVRDLEDELGYALLERSHGGTRLTPAGETLRDSVRHILSDLDFAVEHGRRVASGGAGRLRIGYSQAAFELLAPALQSLRIHGCHAWIDLEEMVASEQAAALHNGRIELALGYMLPPLENTDLKSQHLRKANLQLAVPKLWSKRICEDHSCLSELPLLFMPQATAPSLHASVVSQLDRLRIRPQVIRELPSVRSVLLLIGAGDGFGVLPESIDSDAVAGIDILEKPWLDLCLDTWAFWTKLTPVAEQLLRHLQKENE